MTAPAVRSGSDALALLALLAAAAVAALTFADYGVTWDEPGLRTYGRMLVDWYASGFNDGRAFEFANLRYYGGGFDIVATLLEPLTALDPYATRHLLGGLVGLGGLFLTWRVARHLGGPRAGLIALVLLATLPGWWGHMFFNSKDVPFAVGMLASVAAWIGVLDEWPRPGLRSAALLGLAVGLTLGVRVGGVLVGFYFLLTLIPLLVLDRSPGRWGDAVRACLRLLPALPVAALVLIPAWPWVALAPGNLFEAITYLGKFPYTADTIFAGRRYPAPAVPLAYWPTLLALQLTEVMLAGLVAAAATLPFAAPSGRRLGILTVAIAALFPIAYALIGRPTAYNALRHFIFVLPPLAILAGLGLDRVLDLLKPRLRGPALAVVALACLLPVVRMGQLHPYAYVYFNDVSGGVPAAAGRYELDYWGTSFAELGRLLAARLPDLTREFGPPRIPVRICGPFEASQDVLPSDLLPMRHDAPERLAISIAIFFCLDPKSGAEIARVERLGVPLSRAYRTEPDAVITSFTDRP